MEKEYRPLVYICSAYSGNIAENTENTKKYCRFALDKGQIPLAPHLMFPAFMSEDERELALHMDLVLLGKCQELWVFGGTIPEGMKAEINVAKRRRQPIRYFDSSLNEVKGI